MIIYAFIFCRSGSKGLPHKNIKKMNGISLLKRNINLIKKCKKISKIIVSTDSEEYKKEALEAGAFVPILRPSNLSSDDASEIDAWKFICNYLENKGEKFDIFISLPVVSPLKTIENINNIIDLFIEKKPDMILTVKKADNSPYYNMVIENSDGNLELVNNTMSNKFNRQNFPLIYDITTIAYIANVKTIKKLNNSIFTNKLNIIKYEVDKISGIDIDDINDFKMAEFFHKERIKKKINFSVLNNILLDDKIAIVTGGLGHVGIKIVETLLELNCKVIVIDLYNKSTNEIIENLNNVFESCVDFYNVNLSNINEINNFCSTFLQKYKKIDILVNCAALVGTSQLEGWGVPFTEQSMKTFDLCMNINTKAPIVLIQGLINGFKLSDNAKIINISSIYGIRGNDFSLYEDTDMEAPIAYSISKSGLNIMTKYMATLFGKHNICINSIILGGIYRNQNKKFVERYTKKTPLGRMGKEDDIKGIISFLSGNLSQYVTGQNFVIDGGITCKI